jgi:hypothetical protein
MLALDLLLLEQSGLLQLPERHCRRCKKWTYVDTNYRQCNYCDKNHCDKYHNQKLSCWLIFFMGDLVKVIICFSVFQAIAVIVINYLFSSNAVSVYLFGLFIIETGLVTVLFFARVKRSKAITA